MITLGVPTLKRYDTLARLLTSAENGYLKPDKYVVIDNGRNLNPLTLGDAQAKLQLIVPPTNIGVAASWNKLLTEQEELLIISNDDVELQANTIEHIVRFALDHPDCGFVYGQSDSGDNAWSFFIHRRWLFDQIGPYDETFFPAYFEDNDMGYRISLAGLSIGYASDCHYRHVGSATLKAYTTQEQQQHHRQFNANRDYYLRKWGGLPHQERYRKAFDLG